MDKSLDDIIKSRFNGKKGPKGGGIRTNNNPKSQQKKGILKKPNFKPNAQRQNPQKNGQKLKVQPQMLDARAKIIGKQRAKISDARVLLAKKERQRRQAPAKRSQVPQRTPHLSLHTKKNISVGRKQGNSAPRRMLSRLVELSDDEDEDMLDLDSLMAPVSALRRTVKNDHLPPMPPLPKFGRDLAINDPFDCYEPYERPAFIPTAPPPPKIHMEDLYYAEKSPRKGILRTSSKESHGVKNRLYGAAPDPRQPSGIFGRDRDPDKELPMQNSYRIVVSNLHSSVTQSDIQELFEDIGELVEARMVRPGVAEVLYKRLTDAELAVETYHNRQLDGTPMQCLLVRPRSQNQLSAPQTHGRSINSKNIEVDMDTLHKVLFSR